MRNAIDVLRYMRENPVNVENKPAYRLLLQQIELGTNTTAKLNQNQMIILDNVVRYLLSPSRTLVFGAANVFDAQQVAMWLNTCHR
jgi:hypothetical protein